MEGKTYFFEAPETVRWLDLRLTDPDRPYFTTDLYHWMIPRLPYRSGLMTAVTTQAYSNQILSPNKSS